MPGVWRWLPQCDTLLRGKRMGCCYSASAPPDSPEKLAAETHCEPPASASSSHSGLAEQALLACRVYACAAAEGLARAIAVSMDEVYALEELFQKLSNSLHHVRVLLLAAAFPCWPAAMHCCHATPRKAMHCFANKIIN